MSLKIAVILLALALWTVAENDVNSAWLKHKVIAFNSISELIIIFKFIFISATETIFEISFPSRRSKAQKCLLQSS